MKTDDMKKQEMFSLRIHLLLHQAHYTVVNFVPYLRLTCTFRCQAQHI